MTPSFKIIQGDSLSVLPTLPDNSVDSIVTDPPYELGFMGKSWDRSGIANNVNLWKECLRVLKPGGHLLAFSGSRTYHRMTVAIEDAGFEVRDQIMWVYGSGFPKSLNVSKAIDKASGAEREVVGQASYTRSAGSNPGLLDKSSTWTNGQPVITAPATPLAKKWDGWGTALKPAHEPICVARKPLAKGNTVADNVVEFGTGAINVDGCRVGTDDGQNRARPARTPNAILGGGSGTNLTASEHNAIGRWPANFIHDGSDEVVELFPGEDGKSAARFFYCAKCSNADRDDGLDGFEEKQAGSMDGNAGTSGVRLRGDGSTIETPTRRNNHPTVKPTSLMAYLVRLVTPPGGTVLDPFTGSGSTGKAAMREGFNFIGVELTPEYIPIATARIENERKKSSQEGPVQDELDLE